MSPNCATGNPRSLNAIFAAPLGQCDNLQAFSGCWSFSPTAALPAPAPTAAHVASCQLSARLPRLVRLCAVQTLQTPRLEMQLPAAASPATKARTLGIPDRSLRSGNRARLLRLLGTHTELCTVLRQRARRMLYARRSQHPHAVCRGSGYSAVHGEQKQGSLIHSIGLVVCFCGRRPGPARCLPKRATMRKPPGTPAAPPAALKPDALNR